jgi:hypothetical protein
LGFFTGASGFVFLSGLVSAWAYGAIYSKHGQFATWRRALRRSTELYLVNTSLFLLIFFGISSGLLAGTSWYLEFPSLFAEPEKAFCQALLLLYRPGYLDILPMYILFLIVVTPALGAIRASRGWALMGVSALMWLWVQIFAPESNSLNPFGYQILFVAGLIIGAERNAETIEHSITSDRIAKVSLALASSLFFMRFALGVLRSPGPKFPAWYVAIHLENNGPLRLANFAFFVISAAYVWPRIPLQIRTMRLFRWLAYLGQHPLQVFAWSIFVTYVSIALMPIYPSRLWAVGDGLLAISSLVIPARFHAWVRQRRDSRTKPQTHGPYFYLR